MDDHIIVGYDGSPASAAAVNWAATEAVRRHTSLTVVGCYVIPPVVDFGLTGPAVIAEDSEALRAATRTSIDTIVTALRAAHPALSITGMAVNGSPRRELSRHAEHAGLLVAGTTGAGQAASWLLGSVAHVWRARLRAQSRSSLWSGPPEATEARTARELWWASTSQRDPTRRSSGRSTKRICTAPS